MNPLERLSAALSNRYTIERELGQGGMATRYPAADLKRQHTVAPQVVKPQPAAMPTDTDRQSVLGHA